MFQGLQENQLSAALEALLFVSDEPVSVLTLAEMLEVEPAKVEAALEDLRDTFVAKERGIQLREVAGGWRLFTHPVYHELIEKYVLSWDTRKLSQAALETLAVLAYSQPATRAQVSAIRGVNSDSSINSLVEKGLLREVGCADTPGNPVLYATTRVFLEKFGLKSTADLPRLEEFAPDESARSFIRERLSASRSNSLTPDALADEEMLLEEGLIQVDPEAAEGDVSSPASLSSEASDPQSRRAESASPFAAALASGFGLVEKIDFENLHFETDDE